MKFHVIRSLVFITVLSSSQISGGNSVDEEILREMDNRRAEALYKLNDLFVRNFPLFHKNALYPYLALDSNFTISLYVYPNECDNFFHNGFRLEDKNKIVDYLVFICDFCLKTWLNVDRSVITDIRYADITQRQNSKYTLLITCGEVTKKTTIAYFSWPTTTTYPLILFNRKSKLSMPALLETTCHEIGHYLGMSHDESRNDTIMFPISRGTDFSDYDRDNIFKMSNFFGNYFGDKINKIISEKMFI